MSELAAKTRVLHIIDSLHVGGAETILWRLVGASSCASYVAALRAGGELAEKIRAQGGECVSLLPGRRGRSDISAPFLASYRLRQIARQFRPHVIQAWLYRSNYAAWRIGREINVPVCWSLHCERLPRGGLFSARRIGFKVLARISRSVSAATAVAEGVRQWHQDIGFRPRLWRIIPNGVDADEFRPDPDARQKVLSELGLPPDCFLIGHVARFHPVKGHRVFFRALAQAAKHNPKIAVVAIGSGVTAENSEIMEMSREIGLSASVRMLGLRTDIHGIMPAFDALCLSSTREASPTVLREALACGLPCISTDVGDAAQVLRGTGSVTPPEDATALAAALVNMSQTPLEQRQRMGAIGRRRIIEHYSLATMSESYDQLYHELAAAHRPLVQ